MGIFKKKNDENETPRREKVIFHEGHAPTRPQKTCEDDCHKRAEKYKREHSWWSR